MIKKKVQKILTKIQKPGRYVGGELNEIIKDKNEITVRFAFCFPDVYEIGMSHLGMKILYSLLNEIPHVWCERVFAPWPDMAAEMTQHSIPLYALESGNSIADFDIIGFTLQYELCYTNVLNMLKLAGIPRKSSSRKNLSQIVIAGGPCACNPEPLADFIDLFVIGEGEEVILEIITLYSQYKSEKKSKTDFLIAAAQIEGVYVPSLYTVSYNADGTLCSFIPSQNAPSVIKKRLIKDMDSAYYPDRFVVPMIEIVHDRVSQEIFRGCIRGCRFCQAGFITRPVREKSINTISSQAHTLCSNTGYDEVSLSSLSASDYSDMPNLLTKLNKWAAGENVSISLPSLRADGFSDDILNKIKTVRKSALTFAPEAGSARLRDVINKNISRDELLNTCALAFNGGWNAVKLYFMIGLPTETIADIEDIAHLAEDVVNTYYKAGNRSKGKSVKVSVSASSFIPKPFTPFQWESQNAPEEIHDKQHHLKETIHSKKINYHYHDAYTSFLEAVFARGDRKLGKVLELAIEHGFHFDGWSDFFNFEDWMSLFKQCNLDPYFYAVRKRNFDELLPWNHIDYGIHKSFLIEECHKAYSAQATKNCREKCSGCGINRLTPGCSNRK